MRGPRLIGRHSAIATRWYEALRRSGQSQWFEPSDWATAEIVVVALDAWHKTPTASMLSAIRTGMAMLLSTEGDRRRAGIELERPAPADEESGGLSWIDDARRRLRGDE